ncbi:hypothetical protein DSO57_1022537 [Entomophthora muscae]|uniref:Uncharacterized protein n=1 Tax=Entomophthora muscae TaxID=34485 RepID=A0ACC2TQ68_9FUNG|nr:hypothetical protein DSO57_1022537 [Entomophthora muscae]
MQSTLSIIALSVFSVFLGVQAAPSSQVNRRSYGSTPSYSHKQPKVYAPKVEAYHPKKEVYKPEPVKPSYSPKPYVAEKPAYIKARSPAY